MPSVPQARRPRTDVRRPRLCRLYLEALEERCVPSTVTNLLDSGPGSLRQAILDTPAGGTVDFQQGLTGTITLTSRELAIGMDLIIAGPGADAITISGNHASRVFDIAAPVNVTISALTIADGFASDMGGGLLNTGTLTLTASTFRGNSVNSNSGSSRGGGLFNSGTLTVTGCLFSDNSAASGAGQGLGGGACNGGSGTLNVIGSTFSGNSASSRNTLGAVVAGGGAVCNAGLGALNVTDSVLSGNSVASFATQSGTGGGGIYNAGPGPLSVTDSTLSGNSATGSPPSGIAIFSSGRLTLTGSIISGHSSVTNVIEYESAPAAVSNCTFSGNNAGQSCISGIGMLTVSNSTFSDNRDAWCIWNRGGTALTVVDSSTIVGDTGYGIRNDGTLTAVNCTIAGNTQGGITNIVFQTPVNATFLNCTIANNGGNQILCNNTVLFPQSTATVRLRNTIVAGNGSAANLGTNFSDGRYISQGHNLSSDDGSGFLTGPGDLINIDPRLGPLQNNGGPTQTMALLIGSPAIAAGDPTGATDFDQRGFPRVENGTIDIGAFEAQPAGQATHLGFQAPTSAVAGTPFAITVTALNDFGQPAAGYTGAVHFAASTGSITDYTFSAADQGRHIFAGLVLRRARTDTVTGTDIGNPLITGGTLFTVSPAAADHFTFALAAGVAAGVPFGITVSVQDAYGNAVTGYTGTVHFVLTGLVTAMADYTFTAADQGSHAFSNLVLNTPGAYLLTGMDNADPLLGGSVTFTVFA